MTVVFVCVSVAEQGCGFCVCAACFDCLCACACVHVFCRDGCLYALLICAGVHASVCACVLMSVMKIVLRGSHVKLNVLTSQQS